jgi:hypothetical protein
MTASPDIPAERDLYVGAHQMRRKVPSAMIEKPVPARAASCLDPDLNICVSGKSL